MQQAAGRHTAAPVATRLAGVSRDIAPLLFLAEARQQGIDGALVTIVGIDGGAPKALGAHLAVLADGRHLGQLSGGCVEPAIASEVMTIMAGGMDTIVRFGKGSPFIDIRFPCGGGVDLLVHAAPDPAVLAEALRLSARRQPFVLAFEPEQSRASLSDHRSVATGWQDGVFLRRYLPRTRLLLAGRGPDFEVMARVAAAAEFDLHLATPDEASALALIDLGVPFERLHQPDRPPAMPFDPWTATVLLFHEHEWEHAILARAVAGEGFYVGALGSVRTHAQRRQRLAALGVPAGQIDCIRGPIGLIDRAREPGMLAISVLAEISAARAQLDRA